MTVDDVDRIEEGRVWAIWFAGAKREHAAFHVDSIVLAKEEEAK
jgi:uncharacterized protein YodC (DUF2158 family)